MAYPLVRTLSAGETRGSGAHGGSKAATGSVASVTGAGGGRPFHKSAMSASTDDDEEASPLVMNSGSGNNNGDGLGEPSGISGATAGETGTGDHSAPGRNNYGAMEEGEAGDEGGGGGGGGGDSGGGGVALLGERVKRPHVAGGGGEPKGGGGGGGATAAVAAAAGEGAVQAYMSVRNGMWVDWQARHVGEVKRERQRETGGQESTEQRGTEASG